MVLPCTIPTCRPSSQARTSGAMKGPPVLLGALAVTLVWRPLVPHHRTDPVCGALKLADTLHQAMEADTLLHITFPVQVASVMPSDHVGPPVDFLQHSAPGKGVDRYHPWWVLTMQSLLTGIGLVTAIRAWNLIFPTQPTLQLNQ
ncbi:hypothetical protein E2C01_086219 [Portunus trituberculatus]|uniref:Uncharacterized protein n=1 Tax=Portunus trituberculatus TaxID=210409 RepID=A0A5B7J379_PORTR|nr:hypothetical protein [Portunus trituberculatus]